MTNPNNTDRLNQTLAAFDEANRQDPRVDHDEQGNEVPSELLYAQRMSQTLESFRPDASEALQLAARCQHIERWKIPREDYPMDRKGYLLWRSNLKKMHGERAAEIMQRHGYDEETIDRVVMLVNKKQLKRDDEVQALEDVICLVFLQYYFDEFREKHSEEKLIDIVAKTWRKMSDEGHEAALKLSMSPESLAIIQKAVA
uniref:DUF4202 domain-containing protein n=1 Tax=Roseihalotalea indica TaxID=2867963 RepID=A0AA49JFC9_9BACT|nr:DUF4202 domain-containing protein [Tunicatimonas sp. TK19036]